MGRRRLIATVSLLLALLLLSSRAPAQGGSALVALVTAEPASPSARAVRHELEGLGLDVIVLRPPAETTMARLPLEQAARSVGAIAAVRLVPSGEGAEVWVADRVTGKTVIRRFLVHVDASGHDSAALALGAVELLRASLMELHAPSPPPGELAATSQVRALALPSVAPLRTPRLGLAVSAAIDPGLRGLAPSGAAELGVWAGVARGFGVRAFASLTFAAADVHVREGLVRVTGHLLGAEVSYDFRPAEQRWVPLLGVGVAAAWVGAAGTTSAPLTSHAESTWLWGPSLHLGLGYRVIPGLRLRADALALVVTTPTSIEVAGRAIGQWGQPTLLLSLGVETLLAL
jgi:hypothetical protein